MKQTNTPFLVARSLRCVRGERSLFKPLNFSISPGDALQISGPNGIGKSSVLRMLAGLLEPESGECHCLVDVFYLGHQLGLKKIFTVEENLSFDLRYPKPSREEMHLLLSDLGLSDCLGRCAVELSQGQQQRLALAKCLLSHAKLWLLDEPFSALDSDSHRQWQGKIAEHVQQGGAVIISSHFPLSISGVSLQEVVLASC